MKTWQQQHDQKQLSLILLKSYNTLGLCEPVAAWPSQATLQCLKFNPRFLQKHVRFM